MAKSKHYYIRKAHRYLGVILGIQFLFWTIGGLYFSWNDIDEIHGDFQHKLPPQLSANIHFVSPGHILDRLPAKPDSLQSLQLINILHQAHYAIAYFTDGHVRRIIANAETGDIRSLVNKVEAVNMPQKVLMQSPA